ncbi:MAG: hypothetical protein HC767_09260, partial [Akkermansiaceae bacterium]|nr:hypothetical protein [Akkermansiaceae bacterium]
MLLNDDVGILLILRKDFTTQGADAAVLLGWIERVPTWLRTGFLISKAVAGEFGIEEVILSTYIVETGMLLPAVLRDDPRSCRVWPGAFQRD